MRSLLYSKRDEVDFTTLLWQNNGRQNGLISRLLFSELYKIMAKKVAFLGFKGGAIAPIAPPDPPLPEMAFLGEMHWYSDSMTVDKV